MDAELVAIRVSQHNVAALVVLEPSGPKADQTLDLRFRIATGQSEVEALSVPLHTWGNGRTSPRDFGAAMRRLDRGLLVLVPHQRPAQRLAPEQTDPPGTVAGDLAEEPAPGEVGVARLDHAELVALGVGQDDVALLGA